ncbi:carbohydrate kinase family protein [bacterium]|nr:carbohydrate kinase family protein [bacterium]
MKLIVTGSIAFDYLMSFPGKFSDSLVEGKLDRISVSFLVETLNKRNGGCAANIAYTLALLGQRPVLTGAAGRDFDPYGRFLYGAGVDVSAVLEVNDEYTASFFANTDADNNQIASFYTGAMRYAREISLAAYSGRDVLVIISPNDPAAMQRHAHECREFDLDFIYDPGQQIAWLDGDTLKESARGARILIMNDYETGMFSKKTGMKEADLQQLAETVIVTKGAEGAEIRSAGGMIEIPIAAEKQVLDPTGVGDAFRAGLMTGLRLNLDWDISGRLGSVAAAYVIETDGPQNHSFTIADFTRRYEENFGPCPELAALKEAR